MKKLILTAILASFVSTPAVANMSWGYESSYIDGITSDSISHSKVFANIYETQQMGYNVRFFAQDSDCKEFEPDTKLSRDHTVNGVRVKFAQQCLGNNFISYFPYTASGSNYVISQFRVKNRVDVNGIFFTAKGFNKAWNEYTSRPEAL